MTSLAERLGLGGRFAELKIVGLGDLARSRAVSLRNKGHIVRFLNHMAPQVSEPRLTFYTHKLRRLAKWLKKDFDQATADDLRRLVTFVSKGPARKDGSRYSAGTIHGYKVAIKRFYRWLEGDDEEYPRKVKWIKTSGDTTRIKEPDQLLTAEEVYEMIRHAKTPRNKAIIAFLYESGARVSEMLSMKMRHLEFSGKLVRATLAVSKTQPWTIPLVECRKRLAVWVNYHPKKDDPEAALWSNLLGDGRQALRGCTVGEILKRVARDAGISKRIYSHLFRACSITRKQLAGWPQQAIQMFHGLCKDSKVMKHYSHLSYGDLEQIQRRMNGLPVEERKSFSQGVRCARCGKTNPLYVEVCECGLPTEMKRGAGADETFEARLEKKLQEFLEKRGIYDTMMERFLNALLQKAGESPELGRAVREIAKDMREKPASPEITDPGTAAIGGPTVGHRLAPAALSGSSPVPGVSPAAGTRRGHAES